MMGRVFLSIFLVFLSCLLGILGSVYESSSLNCGNSSLAVGLHSTYNDGTGREFSIVCIPQPETILSMTQSTHNTTHSQQYTVSSCADNALVTGLQQSLVHDGRLEVSCSSYYNKYSLIHCNWSRWLNKPGEDFSVPGLPWPWVIKSVFSHKVKKRSDYRYKLELCQLTYHHQPHITTDTADSSCHVPAIPHGIIQSVDHTYSITDDYTPFKIKISVTCNQGYYINKNDIVSICQDGTWTQIPTCEKCTAIGYCDEIMCTNSTDSICLHCLPNLPNGLPLVISNSKRRCRAVPVISTGDLAVGFVAGSNLTLDCIVEGRPTPSMTWHRVLYNGSRVPLLDHTHFVRYDNGSLTIVNINDMDSGLYVCRAWNAAGSDIVYIDVYNSHPVDTGPPVINDWCPLHVTNTLTDVSYYLHCTTRGYPPPTHTWSQHHNITTTTSPHHTFHTIQSSTISQYENGTLKFKLVRNVDTALYQCVATNLFGTVSMETILFVESANEKSTPLIVDLPASYTMPEGAALNITCTVRIPFHSSDIHILWMMTGRRVPISGTRVWQNGNGILVFESILASDKGPYWCVVWNEDSVAIAMTELIINNTISIPALSNGMTIKYSLFLITSLIAYMTSSLL